MSYDIANLDLARCRCSVRIAGHNFPRYKQCHRVVVPGCTGPCGGHGTLNELGLAPTCRQHSSEALAAREARSDECDRLRRDLWYALRRLPRPARELVIKSRR